MNFCNQNGNGFESLQTTESAGGCGCPDGKPGASGPTYEPLTAEWFKEYAGILTLIATVIFFAVRNN